MWCSSILARAILAAFMTAMSAGYANAQQFEAVFSGLNEVPPVISPGQGSLQMTLSPASLSYTLIFSNLNSIVAAAHIQFARARDNGGVIAFLCGGGGKPSCPSGPNGTVSGTITAADVIGPAPQGLNAGDFDALHCSRSAAGSIGSSSRQGVARQDCDSDPADRGANEAGCRGDSGSALPADDQRGCGGEQGLNHY
jgi:hypothetical protein